MKKIILLLISILLVSPIFAEEFSSGFITSRDYPGGRDEEDLRVQEEIQSAPPGADRKSIEDRALKTYFKKDDKPEQNSTKSK